MHKQLHALMLHELKDLYDAENQLAAFLPTLSKEASSPELKQAFIDHAEQTTQQIANLEDVFQSLGEKPERVPCVGIKGILKEGQKSIEEFSGNGQAKDAALIGAATKVEHYEMAAYQSAWMLAQAMDHTEAAKLLEKVREQEEAASRKLTKLGTSIVGMTMGQRVRGMMP